MPASYPTAAKSFTNKSNGQAIDASHVTDLQAEVTAIEADLVAGLPVARGGTGLTAIGADGTTLVSNGSAYVATALLTADAETTVIAMQVFS